MLRDFEDSREKLINWILKHFLLFCLRFYLVSTLILQSHNIVYNNLTLSTTPPKVFPKLKKKWYFIALGKIPLGKIFSANLKDAYKNPLNVSFSLEFTSTE